MRSYPVKENHIGSAVSEILHTNKHTNTQTDILLLYVADPIKKESYYLSPKLYRTRFSYEKQNIVLF